MIAEDEREAARHQGVHAPGQHTEDAAPERRSCMSGRSRLPQAGFGCNRRVQRGRSPDRPGAACRSPTRRAGRCPAARRSSSSCNTPSTVGQRALVQRVDDLAVVERLASSATASCRTCPAAYASADVGSMLPALPPYFFTYAATNALLPGEVESGNQSPVEKMPLTLFAPTLLGNSAGIVRPVREEDELRAVLELDQRLDLRVGVVVLRAADDEVGLLARVLRDDRRQVRRLGRVDRLVNGLDPRGLEQRADAVGDRRCERVVERRVRGGLRARSTSAARGCSARTRRRSRRPAPAA